MKNFINISDLSSEELRSIIEEAKSRKLKRKNLNKSSPDEDIKPSVNLDYVDEATLEENITAAGDYYDYDGRESIDSLEDIGMDIY